MSRRRSILLALPAGAAAALGHAPFGLWPVALVGFAVLTWLVAAPVSPGRTALIGWAGGVGYFALSLNWIVEPFLVDIARQGWMAPFALVFLSGGLALFWGLAAWLTARIGGRRALVWAVALATAELARGHVLTGFPWALPAYIWADTPVRMTAAIWGPYGLTFLTLAICALPFCVRNVAGRVALGGLAAAAVAALFITGMLRDGTDYDTGHRIRMVQPNAPQRDKWDPEKSLGFLQRQIDYTAADKTAFPPSLIVWPETAIPYLLSDAVPIFDGIAEAAQGIPVILGITREDNGRYYNSMVSLDSTGQVVDVYDKVHLVPFGEYIPLGQLARLIGLQSFAARDGYGFSAGSEARLIETPLGRALPMICYETIFPDHIRRASERPDFMLQITNDAWFGTFSGPYQHLAQAQFRAAEQGLPLVRVANTGVSAMIDARGEIKVMLPLGVAGFRDAQLPKALPPTPYARTGDLPLALMLLVGLLGLGLAARRKSG